KDRQAELRSQEHQKARNKIELLIQQEGRVSEKALSIAREHSFSKEKVYQIWGKIKSKKDSHAFARALYQAPFGILLYVEGNNNITSDYEKKLKLKKLPLASLFGYFQPVYSLKINLKEANNNLEEYLIASLPSEVWEKVDYNEDKKELISRYREELEKISKKLEITQEKSWWEALVPCQLTTKEQVDYYQELEKLLKEGKFYTNIQKEGL
ncbi:887_t:CDS:1, partial [Racocetra persica]